MIPSTTPGDLARGRTQQKQRTRNALVTAAQELVARGLAPTVEDAAAAAAISRTTASGAHHERGRTRQTRS